MLWSREAVAELGESYRSEDIVDQVVPGVGGSGCGELLNEGYSGGCVEVQGDYG